MKITTLPWAVLRLQYRVARVPLQLFEWQVISRLNEESPARLFYERAVGAVDAAAGSVLADSELESRGTARIERAEALGEAVRLDEVAARRMSQADAELRRSRDAAAEAPTEARAKARDRVQSAQENADQRKQQAVQTATQRTASVKQGVDEAAEQRVAAAEKAERTTEERSRAAEQSVKAAAKAELDDAADKRSAATGARAHADRLEELSDTESEKRQAAKASES
ncbi:hypothetical protein Mycch_0755 [Mycolicibacterium chubuense NBB4]|uniref:IF2 family translation initiation factor n=1 Tax=Mycolicibacterium chubuense (strain NBB4) TaxID=710421 RepID=I4BE65_MYCCN|nr:hypothetical protein [Mycolicibacterium chubuense]AFM15572.1 hypothetical protein Mycch_0755 [Mycolicibacterium chubuense NBB4]